MPQTMAAYANIWHLKPYIKYFATLISSVWSKCAGLLWTRHLSDHTHVCKSGCGHARL